MDEGSKPAEAGTPIEETTQKGGFPFLPSEDKVKEMVFGALENLTPAETVRAKAIFTKIMA